MLKSLHFRLFTEAADSNFQSAFMDYYNERAEFQPNFMSQEGWETMAKEKVSFRNHIYSC
jgi:hypothetical protein